MTEISMKQLLEAGVHFGHQTSRWNPKMKQYIFGARNGIYSIDLQQTVKMFRATFDFARDLAAAGGTMLFVGTKKQAQDIVKEEAERCGMYYVNNRWLGGMLTNFQTIRAEHLHRLLQIDNVDTVAGAENVLLHLRVPAAGLMAKMNSGLQELLHADFSHRILSLPLGPVAGAILN